MRLGGVPSEHFTHGTTRQHTPTGIAYAALPLTPGLCSLKLCKGKPKRILKAYFTLRRHRGSQKNEPDGVILPAGLGVCG